MPKYIIEIDSDDLGTKAFLMVMMETLAKDPRSNHFIKHACVWEDDGSTFISKGNIFDTILEESDASKG